MIKSKEKSIKIVLILSIIINLFIPKMIMVNSDIMDTLSDTIKCQSGVLYFATLSTLSLGLLNDLLASKLGLTIPKQTQSGTKTKKDKNTANTSSADFTLVSSGENLLTRTNNFRFVSPVYGVFCITSISHEYLLLQSIDFQLHILCLLVLCLFFMLPRGSIDNYAFMTTQWKL